LSLSFDRLCLYLVSLFLRLILMDETKNHDAYDNDNDCTADEDEDEDMSFSSCGCFKFADADDNCLGEGLCV